MSWQDHHYLRIDINSVASDSKELPIEERRRLLWEVLKDNYHDDEVEVTSPNGDKTYLKKYGDTPFLGVVNFFYSCGETNVGVFIYIGPKFSLLHIFSEDNSKPSGHDSMHSELYCIRLYTLQSSTHKNSFDIYNLDTL